MRDTCKALLIDLDGVLRYFSIERLAAVEERHGLRAGALPEIAFHHSLLNPVVEGEISHAEWELLTAEALHTLAWPTPENGPDDRMARARAAVADWQSDHGEVDKVVLEFVREVRAAGLPVALCTNATDRLDADLAELGLAGQFDHVVNSSVLKLRKPDKAYFVEASATVGVPPKLCLFVDDSDRIINGARVAGMASFRFTGHSDLDYLRVALGLPKAG
ncbi:haloacid dehalogenase [Longispora fulva]|uniref:Putative hydrolase of the HAD superfamily n=1 Tax=Longispora fulva TaxID=619741 RepID=A0A8J7KK97_9ACTN|nr:HAD-IA family hydrolase [Longispora fulva]MBG6141075.1 putative hydrolase of the HAD superfamily [Longispora fulva]GIG60656.1 haloacid dehalogenase [Longispora fulva]